MTAQDNRPLIGGIVLGGAAVLGLLAVLCWIGVLPVADGARTPISVTFAIAAVADAAVGWIFLTRSRRS